MNYKGHKYDNTVIKNLNPEFGKRMIEWWKEQGVDASSHEGDVSEAGLNSCIYYGLINGEFNNYTIGEVSDYNDKIIELPESKEGKILRCSELGGYELAPISRNLSITIDQAKGWLKSDIKELKDLALKTFPEIEKKELPKTWEELEKVGGWFVDNLCNLTIIDNADINKSNRNVFSTKEEAEADIALAQLTQLRKVYRDGWIPDWTDRNQGKYCVYFCENEIDTCTAYSKNYFLAFQSEEVRDEFENNFSEIIIAAKPLLG